MTEEETRGVPVSIGGLPISPSNPYVLFCDGCEKPMRDCVCGTGRAGDTREGQEGAPVSLQTISEGDTVLHRPTGETWVVRSVQGEYLSWFGYPPGRARVADCERAPVSLQNTTKEEPVEETRGGLLSDWCSICNFAKVYCRGHA